MFARTTIKDFRGVEKADLELSKSVTLIAGNNHEGKSSIMQALVCAFLGTGTPLTGLTQQMGGVLVRSGAVSGQGLVELTTEYGGRRVRWPSCKAENFDGEPPYASEFAVGYWDLLSMDKEKRAAEVVRLTECAPTQEDLVAELNRVKVTPGRIEAEVAMVFGVVDKEGKVIRPAKGFDAAHDAVRRTPEAIQARFGKADWYQIWFWTDTELDTAWMGPGPLHCIERCA